MRVKDAGVLDRSIVPAVAKLVITANSLDWEELDGVDTETGEVGKLVLQLQEITGAIVLADEGRKEYLVDH